MRDYIENHKIGYVTIHDFSNDLTSIRGISDIGLTCSKSEALGRVTVENMLSSLLVVGADTCGTTEIIRDGENGLLYPAGDYHALAEVIMKAINDPESSNKMRARGYAEAVSYDNKEYARKITEIYRSLIR
jgi:glycosyltransferase involved in cell wall biosynthesis